MSTKHTPGPWGVDDDFNGIYIDTASRATMGRMKLARIVHGRGEAEDLANARLVAAAPDMLKALQAALSLVDHGREVGQILADATAKATGQ